MLFLVLVGSGLPSGTAQAATYRGLLSGSGDYRFTSVVGVPGAVVAVGEWTDPGHKDGNTYIAGQSHPLIVKLSTDGAILWSKPLTTAGGCGWFNSVAVLDDGNVIAAGTACPADTSQGRDFLIAKFDLSGRELWRKTQGHSSDDDLDTVIRSASGGFVAVGSYWLSGAYNSYIAGFDSNGQELWSDAFRGGQFNSVATLPNGNYLAGGIAYSTSTEFPTSATAGLTVEYTPAGHREGGHLYSGLGSLGIVSLVAAADGSVLIAGSQSLAKLSSATGATLWKTTVTWSGGYSSLGLPTRKWATHTIKLSGLVATSDGGALAVGRVESDSVEELPVENGIAVRFRTDGKKQWIRNVGGDFGTFTGFAAAIPSGQGFILAGQTDMYSHGYKRAATVTPVTATGGVSWIATGLLPALSARKAPKITGTIKVGKKLKASKGSWSAQPASVKYQWLRNGRKIAGATSSTYRLKKADRGKRVSVVVAVHRAGFRDAHKRSSRTAKVSK